MVKQFTDFPYLGSVQASDKLVGTRDDVNIQVDFDSGIKDSSGYYIFAYESVSSLIKNYLKFKNADSGSPAQITTDGVDTNISMLFTTKGDGNFTTSTTGLGNINFTTQSGKFYINSTAGINAILDEDDMASDSATAIPTQQSVKAYVDATAEELSDLTFITNTDESADLPNSHQLLGTSNQITATNGTLSLPSTLIAPGTFRATTSINIGGAGATITSFSIDGTLAGNSDALSPTQKAVKTYVDTADTAIKSYSYITKTDNTANLPGSTPLSGLASGFLSNTTATGVLNPRTHTGTTNQIDITNGSGVSGNPTYQLSSTLVTPGSVTLGGDLNVATHKIVSNSGTPIQLIPNNDSDGIDLSSSIVRIDTDLRHAGEPNNKIAFTTAAQTYYIGGSSIYDINASGFRLGTGYRVNSISNSYTSVLDTDLMTAYATQMAISSAIDSGVSFRGGWDASGGLYPSTGGTGVAGVIEKGNWWYITVAGTLSGTVVQIGDWITALIDVPGQTGSNWLILREGVNSVFGRNGAVVAVSGDYSYSQITGLPSTATSGKLMRGTGSAWAESTATYPDTATTGDLIYASSANTWANLADVATGNALISGGVGVIPSWGKISLTAAVSGILPTANGGTGNSSGQAASVANALTVNNSGSGVASGSTFDGSVARTISYNTLGASPLAGSSSITTVGTITSGTWQGTAVDGAHGGTGQTTTTSGDLLVGAGSNTWSKLATNLSSALTTSEFGALRWTNLGLGEVVMGSFTSGAVAGTISAGTGLGSSFGVGNITLSLSVPVTAANGGTGLTGVGTSGNVLTSNGSVWSSAAPAVVPLTFNTVTGSTQAMAVNNSYYSTYAGTCVMTLPSTAAVGSEIEVMTDSSHVIQIAQNANQLIYVAALNGVSNVTATGVGGSLTTADPNTVIKLKCIVANTTWIVTYFTNTLSGV